MTEILPHVLPHVLFGFGGGVGALARHALSVALPHRFPLATLIVNVAGCLALGLGVAILEAGPAEPPARDLVYGFCGGLTTFSSFVWQTLDLHRTFTILHAAANILASLAACLIAFEVGLRVGAG